MFCLVHSIPTHVMVTYKAMLCFVLTALLNSRVVQLEEDVITDLAVEKLASLQQLHCTVLKGPTTI